MPPPSPDEACPDEAGDEAGDEASDPLVRAGRAIGQASAMLNHAAAERLGLHPTAWECLSLLFEHGAMTAGKLAEVSGLTTGAVTGLVDRLEAAGYVCRRRDAHDRRRVIVEVLPAAMRDAMPLFRPMLADMRDLHRRYSDAEMAAMVDCLDQAAAILRGHALRIRSETPDTGSA